MKIKNAGHGRTPFLLLWVIFIGSLAGCTQKLQSTPTPQVVQILPSSTSPAQHSPTPTILPPTFTASSTVTRASITPTSTAMVTSTPEATLTTNEVNDTLLDLLETNGGCDLPCLWGITPGKTWWEDARYWIDHLGWSVHEVHREKDSLYSVEFQNHRDDFTMLISNYVKDGIVDFVDSQLIVYSESPRLAQFEQQFSPRVYD